MFYKYLVLEFAAFILLVINFSCSGTGNKPGSNEVFSNIDSSKSKSSNQSCDSLSIMVRFIDESKAKIWDDGVLVILIKGEEHDLREIASDQNRVYPLEDGSFICLNKKMLSSKYHVSEIDSLGAFVYKRGVGLSNGFSIYLGKSSMEIPIRISIRD